MNTDGILQLLQIMDLAKQWPQLQAIHDISMAQLVDANEKAAVELKAIAYRKAEAKAEAEAKAAAERKAEVDALVEKARRDEAQQAQLAVQPRAIPNPEAQRENNPPATPSIIDRRDV